MLLEKLILCINRISKYWNNTLSNDQNRINSVYLMHLIVLYYIIYDFIGKYNYLRIHCH